MEKVITECPFCGHPYIMTVRDFELNGNDMHSCPECNYNFIPSYHVQKKETETNRPFNNFKWLTYILVAVSSLFSYCIMYHTSLSAFERFFNSITISIVIGLFCTGLANLEDKLDTVIERLNRSNKK